MYNSKEREMREEAKAAIIEALENGYDGYYFDLHNKVFNTDNIIIGEDVLFDMLYDTDVWEDSWWSRLATPETNAAILKEVKQ